MRILKRKQKAFAEIKYENYSHTISIAFELKASQLQSNLRTTLTHPQSAINITMSASKARLRSAE